jgi:hypothetical protein
VLADGRTVHRGPADTLLADAEATRRLLGVGRRASPADDAPQLPSEQADFTKGTPTVSSRSRGDSLPGSAPSPGQADI